MLPSWSIYALGGGWGHLTRAVALARAASRLARVEILTNSPYVRFVHEPSLVFRSLPPADRERTVRWVRDHYRDTEIDLLIVDTFPRGLAGELVELWPRFHGIPKVLVHRDLNPEYVRARDLRRFVATAYDLVLIPGEGEGLPLASGPGAFPTEPWLSRHGWELSRGGAYRILNLAGGTGTVLVLTSGKEEELGFYGELTLNLLKVLDGMEVMWVSPFLPPGCPRKNWRFHYPAIECLPAAALVLGSGGYNTVVSCRALEIPLIVFPRPRLYDRQRERASRLSRGSGSPLAIAEGIAEGGERARDLLNRQRVEPVLDYPNGVTRAVESIRALV